jgi:hypothetical protein
MTKAGRTDVKTPAPTGRPPRLRHRAYLTQLTIPSDFAIVVLAILTVAWEAFRQFGVAFNPDKEQTQDHRSRFR